MGVQRKVHTAGFKANVALTAYKADRTVNQLAGQYDIHPTRIHAWKKQPDRLQPRAATSIAGRLEPGSGV
jgi:transposase-like protein